ncbi:DUF202 domain-containing protein [Kushneria phosphatilytica]|uniref:DUF202 domain-containing protein n=1 Tax=Kushneria phosphatilytica TaxID=657387 RepID=A0A1S1NS46_9GAMM|nr:DUF202 domain-containing protein [Kushneria phosphatilytica]OHV08037.1 hypothetical protein BH688_14610 [Kushneria phosphatilytica]QEL09949.1 DUF202 domain-containing protein [Kushneria phosphatilytica]
MTTPNSTRDPGLQPERTGLSWSRTAFLLLLNSALITRAGFEHHDMLLTVVGIALLAATGAMYAWAGIRLHIITTTHQPVSPLSGWAMRLTAAVVCLAALSVCGDILYQLWSQRL